MSQWRPGFDSPVPSFLGAPSNYFPWVTLIVFAAFGAGVFGSIYFPQCPRCEGSPGLGNMSFVGKCKGTAALKKASKILVVVAALGCSAASASSDQHILFAVRDYSHSVVANSGSDKSIQTLIEPFAYIVNGKLVNIPGETDRKKFEDTFYTGDKRYTLYSAGRATGYVQIIGSAFDIQCESFAASAQASPPDIVRGKRMALASDTLFRDNGLKRRPPTLDERRVLIELATREYAKNKISIALARQIEVRNIAVFEGGPAPMMIGSFVVGEKTDRGGDGHDTIHAVFLIAEKTDAGQYGSTHSWFKSGTENEIETQDLVDVLDIDGDGTPEVVTQFGYYESNAYHVYKKADGKWADVYSNFGSGC